VAGETNRLATRTDVNQTDGRNPVVAGGHSHVLRSGHAPVQAAAQAFVRVGDGTVAGALVLGKRNNRKAKGPAVVGVGGELVHGVAIRLVVTARCR